MNHLENKRIVLCFPVETRHVDQIRATAPDCDVVDAGQDRIAEEILDADIFCGHAKVPVPWDDVVARGRLSWIQSSAAGLDHCLVPCVIGSPIAVSSASGLFANQVAEQTLALLLALVRRMHIFFDAQKNKIFERRPTDDLYGKTVGIVGLGGNGRRIAHVLAPMGVRILATDWYHSQPAPNGVEVIWPAPELDRLLRQADVVIVCVPLNEQTYHLFGPSEFGQMKDSAYLINVARGPVLDESALLRRLAEGAFSGVGLDVTETEPLSADNPLWESPRVIITPHVGAQSHRRVDSTVDFFCKNLMRMRNGQAPMNLVDKVLGFPRPEHRDSAPD